MFLEFYYLLLFLLGGGLPRAHHEQRMKLGYEVPMRSGVGENGGASTSRRL